MLQLNEGDAPTRTEREGKERGRRERVSERGQRGEERGRIERGERGGDNRGIDGNNDTQGMKRWER